MGSRVLLLGLSSVVNAPQSVRPLLPAIRIRLVAILKLELCVAPVVTVLCRVGSLLVGAQWRTVGLL